MSFLVATTPEGMSGSFSTPCLLIVMACACQLFSESPFEMEGRGMAFTSHNRPGNLESCDDLHREPERAVSRDPD